LFGERVVGLVVLERNIRLHSHVSAS
jgi:hypothetical protein